MGCNPNGSYANAPNQSLTLSVNEPEEVYQYYKFTYWKNRLYSPVLRFIPKESNWKSDTSTVTKTDCISYCFFRKVKFVIQLGSPHHTPSCNIQLNSTASVLLQYTKNKVHCIDQQFTNAKFFRDKGSVYT